MSSATATISISRLHRQFLEQERRRLKDEYGIVVTWSEIVQGLIEQHKMRMIQMASENSDSVAWFYSYLAENQDERERV